VFFKSHSSFVARYETAVAAYCDFNGPLLGYKGKSYLNKRITKQLTTPNEIGSKSLSDNLPSTKALVECSVSRMEDGKRSSKVSRRRMRKNWRWFQTVLLRILFVARPLKLKGKALLLMNHVKKKTTDGPSGNGYG